MAEEEKAVTSREFCDYGIPLEMVISFQYLGRMISVADDYWPEVTWNLTKAWAVWRRMTRILVRQGARPGVSGFFFKAVVQLVLLFGAETWVVNPRMVQVLWGFQDQVARRLTGRILRRRVDGKWEYTSAEAERIEVGFETMDT